MDVPEHIGGNDGHPAGLHLAELLLPLRAGIPAVMELPQHRNRRLSVQGQVVAVHLDGAAIRSGPTQIQMAGFHDKRLRRRINPIHLRSRRTGRQADGTYHGNGCQSSHTETDFDKNRIFCPVPKERSADVRLIISSGTIRRICPWPVS